MRVMLFAVVLLAAAQVASAETEFTLAIKDHRFEPAELTVPAGERIKLIVDNQDSTPEEFESHDMHSEKIIPGNTKATIWVGPLSAGTYSFFGEFNEDTAQGHIIAE